MASLGTEEDDGDLAGQLNPDHQGDSGFLSSGGDEYYQLHPDQGAGGFVFLSDDEVSVGVDGFTLHAAGAGDDDTTATTYSDDEMDFDYNSGGEGYQTPPATPMTPPAGGYSAYYHGEMGFDYNFGGEGYQTPPATPMTPPAGGYSAYYHGEMGFDYNFGGEGYQTPPAMPMTPPAGGYSAYYHVDMGFDYNFGDEGYQTPLAAPMTPPGGTYSVYYHVDVDTEFVGEEGDPFFPVEEEAPAATAVALEAAEAPVDDCCPVCLVQEDDDGEAGATWSRVAACGHRFHAACVEKWLRVKPTCPVCRCSVAAAVTGAEHPNVVEELMTSGYSSYDLLRNAVASRDLMFEYFLSINQ